MLIVHDDRDRIDFTAALADACRHSGGEVHAYCLMSNHYHLLVRAPLEALAAMMHGFGTTYTRHVNDRWERDGPLFRGRFQSVPIGDDQQLMRCLRYIHRNPVAIVGSEALDGYRWSSHRCYLGAARVPHWLEVDTLLARFDGVAGYQAFISAHDQPTAVILDEVRYVVTSLSCEFDDLRPGDPLCRSVALVLADRHPAPAGDLVSELAFASSGALWSARSRARARLAADCEFGELLRRVEATLQLGSDPE